MSTRLLFFLAICFCYFSCSETEPVYTGKMSMEYPGEYMYNQRAYPNKTIDPEARKEAIKGYKEKLNISRFDGPWISDGPFNTGGRVSDIARHPQDPNSFYIGTANGGIFKTTDGGENFNPTFEEAGVASIGNIGISTSNPDILYVGTGEASGSATSGAFFGNGIYKSEDAGLSWTNVGLQESGHIGRIVVDPNDSDIAYVAANGTLYGKNNERGLYKTSDGGSSWEQLLFLSDSTACIDVAVNPQNPDIIYAAMWERTRKAWARDYGGVTSGLHRSADGGQTWELITNGLPNNDESTGRIGVTISQSNPNTIYAVFTENEITNSFAGVYKSIDNGLNWFRVDEDLSDGVFSSFGWFFGNLRVDPTNEDLVYILGQSMYRSFNGGINWEPVFGMHVDHHAMEFFTGNTDDILFGNDGGTYRSIDGGDIKSHYENIPNTQFYQIEVDEQIPERKYGGTQDNNTIRTLTGQTNDFAPILGGDGFYVLVNPTNSDNIYAEYQWGNLFVSFDGGYNMIPATNGIDDNDRTNWNTPVAMSPVDPITLFYGSNKLYISDQAYEWTAITDDLTKGQHPSGSISYGTITVIAPSYQNTESVYVGTDDGNVWFISDFGTKQNLIIDGLPDRYVTGLAVNPENDADVYVTFSGFKDLDYSSHIFHSTDHGENWASVQGDLPDMPINDIVIDPLDNSMLYIATDLGVWVSSNFGNNWEILGTGMPPGVVNDLRFHEETRQLTAGTFGRSMYTIDLTNFVSDVNDVEDAFTAELYPNPSSEYLNITSDQLDLSLSIFDISGKLILKTQANQTIDVSQWKKGSYIVQMNSSKGRVVKKLLVQ